MDRQAIPYQDIRIRYQVFHVEHDIYTGNLGFCLVFHRKAPSEGRGGARKTPSSFAEASE